MPCLGSLVPSSAVLEVAWPCWSQGGLLCEGPQGGFPVGTEHKAGGELDGLTRVCHLVCAARRMLWNALVQTVHCPHEAFCAEWH